MSKPPRKKTIVAKRKKNPTYSFTPTVVARAKKLVEKEGFLNNHIKEQQIEAMVLAYKIGKIIQKEVVKKYGDDAMGQFAEKIGLKKETARTYFYLARGLANEAVLRKFTHLNRLYFMLLGKSIPWHEDVPGDYLHYSLLKYPRGVRDENTGKITPDVEAIGKIKKLLNATRRIINEELKVGYALRSHQWERWDKVFEDEDFSVVLLIKEKDVDKIDKIQEAMYACILLFHEAARMVGWTHVARKFPQLRGKTVDTVAPYLREIKKGDTPKTITYKKNRNDLIISASKQSTPAQKLSTKDKVYLGRSEKILMDIKKFPKRSVDVCLTDPPYSKEYYDPWRPETEVNHHSEKTIKQQVKVVAEVADLLFKRRIAKEQFIWMSFCPLDLVHEFLPPLLKVFPRGSKYQILVWDKLRNPKRGGHTFFGRQAEAVLYISVNRPLAILEKNDKMIYLHSSVFPFRAPSQTGKNFSWKPEDLLMELIKLASYEMDTEEANRQLILDPFCGSGSTAVAAIKCNRDYRLIECHKEQHKLANAQVLNALAAQKKTKIKS